jgi:hypothetical protein
MFLGLLLPLRGNICCRIQAVAVWPSACRMEDRRKVGAFVLLVCLVLLVLLHPGTE